ncbi:MAG: chromate transporter, partial [Actinomycetales bacterium]|nr:chromate transporter [Actinomycetales bacterium]
LARVRSMHRVRRAIMGANAGVVGLLAAALWDPVIAHGVTSLASGLVAAAGFAALLTRRVPPWAVVVGSAALGAALL